MKSKIEIKAESWTKKFNEKMSIKRRGGEEADREKFDLFSFIFAEEDPEPEEKQKKGTSTFGNKTTNIRSFTKNSKARTNDIFHSPRLMTEESNFASKKKGHLELMFRTSMTEKNKFNRKKGSKSFRLSKTRNSNFFKRGRRTGKLHKLPVFQRTGGSSKKKKGLFNNEKKKKGWFFTSKRSHRSTKKKNIDILGSLNQGYIFQTLKEMKKKLKEFEKN